MLDNDLKNILLNAQQEISILRRENEILRAKVEVMDLFACVLNTQPARQSVSMGEDVVWRISVYMEEQEPSTP